MPKVNVGRPDFMELTAEILSRGDILRFQARGGSMYPFIKDGDIIEVKPRTTSAIRVGDVVFYRSAQGQLLAHRVIKAGIQYGQVALVTKGDSVSNSDPLVHPEQVLGQVVAVKRGERTIRLDRGVYRFISAVWARLSPYSPWLYPILRRAKRVLHRIVDIGRDLARACIPTLKPRVERAGSLPVECCSSDHART